MYSITRQWESRLEQLSPPRASGLNILLDKEQNGDFY